MTGSLSRRSAVEQSRSGLRRRSRRLATAVVAAVLVAVWPVVSVAAHARFVSMSPADGSLVTTAPDQVVITFNEPIQDIGTSFLVQAPSGASVASGSPVVSDNTVTQALTPLVEQGTYEVAYRVTSTDGHPISRGLTFAFGSRAAGTSAVPTSSAQPLVATSSSQAAATGPVVVGAAAVGLAVVVGLGYQVARRRDSSAVGAPVAQDDPPEDTW